MANFSKYAPKVLKYEGGYTVDHAGPTNKGITLDNWKAFGYDKNGDRRINVADLKQITNSDAQKVYKKQYWDYFHADQILDQSVAEMIVDWGVNSGQPKAAIILNRILGVSNRQNTVSSDTIARINSIPGHRLFEYIKAVRKSYYDYLAVNPNPPYAQYFKDLASYNPAKYKRFHKGWINHRIKPLMYHGNSGIYHVQKIVTRKPQVKVNVSQRRITSYTPNIITKRKPVIKTKYSK